MSNRRRRPRYAKTAPTTRPARPESPLTVQRVWLLAHTLQIDTPAADLDPALRVWAVERAADAAIENSRPAVVVGVAGERLVLCLTGCCLNRPGVLIVLDDLTVAEGHANGLQLPPGTARLLRADGRSTAVFAGTGGGRG